MIAERQRKALSLIISQNRLGLDVTSGYCLSKAIYARNCPQCIGLYGECSSPQSGVDRAAFRYMCWNQKIK
jgi:hypothetical protein